MVDYDGDGKLDVLLGDFCTYLHIRKDLTPQQRREFEATRDRQEKVAKQLRESMEALQGRWKAMMKDVPKSDWHTPENSAKWLKMYKEMRESPAYKECRAEYERLDQDLRKYVDAGAARAGSPDVAHGYIWLFRRQ